MTTITVPRAVLEQALEALEQSETLVPYEGFGMLRREAERKHEAAIAALKAALAQEEKEPVVWGVDWGSHGDRSCCVIIKQQTDGTREVVAVEYAPSYTHPPRREWQSLTEDEIDDLSRTMVKGNKSVNWLTLAILAALKEKNNG